MLKRMGGSNLNGSTSRDRTNYYETVPSNRLEAVLNLESSRMGFMLEHPNLAAALENQRNVVKNERRQRYENAPMGVRQTVTFQNLFPEGHPYRHTVIGSMADLSAASLDDIREFFDVYYAPNNATLLIAGDYDEDKTRAWVKKYFGPIPAGRAVPRRPFPKAGLKKEKVLRLEAKIARPAGFMNWATAPGLTPDEAALDVLAAILTSGKNARLFKRLVYDEKARTRCAHGTWA